MNLPPPGPQRPELKPWRPEDEPPIAQVGDLVWWSNNEYMTANKKLAIVLQVNPNPCVGLMLFDGDNSKPYLWMGVQASWLVRERKQAPVRGPHPPGFFEHYIRLSELNKLPVEMTDAYGKMGELCQKILANEAKFADLDTKIGELKQLMVAMSAANKAKN